MTESTAARVGSIMLDCNDLDAMVEFWGSILDIEERVRFPQYVWMSRVSPGGPALAFQHVPEEKTTKNRMHLDLNVPEPEVLIGRVVDLGGERLQDHDVAGFHWTVCADPEGNEFCITKSE